MKQHINIPIFIPHLGCPNCCVFCNQRTISGVTSFDVSSVKQIIDSSIASSVGKEREIAFFGGSFTGIDRELMESLLKIAYEYVMSGEVTGIRCSTRPDYISEEVLSILKKYGVKTVELGIQSVSEAVLDESKRGHNSDSIKQACEFIVGYDFELVGQMMIGLPKSTLEDEITTAEFIARCGAKSARVYPTVVFNGTELCEMAKAGDYTPLSLDDAIYRAASVCRIFHDNGIKVIRIGLCSSESVLDDENYYAGPMHPALGELVENEIYYSIIKEKLNSLGNLNGKEVTVRIPRGAASKAIGQKKKNKLRLIDDFKLKNIYFAEDDTINAFDELSVQERKRAECI